MMIELLGVLNDGRKKSSISTVARISVWPMIGCNRPSESQGIPNQKYASVWSLTRS